MRVLYFAGPGDIVSTYEYWNKGVDDPTETNVTYSGRFFSLCKKKSMSAYVVSTNRNIKSLINGAVTVEHRPNNLDQKGGFLFHAGQLMAGIRMVFKAITWKADYVIVSSGTHWFLLWPLALLGIKIIPTIHCVIRPKYKKRNVVNKCIDYFNGLFFKYVADEIMSASKEITRQLKRCNVDDKKVHEFLPLYKREGFDKILPIEHKAKPFRILYVGRIEKVKGVFDLLKVFEKLTSKGLDVELSYCGTGGALSSLEKKVISNSKVTCYGHCNREDLLSIINSVHVFVVPTTTDFVEGFNQVVVEAILSGRPVVTSDVCPAMEYVLEAALECEPDNIESYIDNIESLYKNEALYKLKQKNCEALQEDFYDESNSWGNVLEKILSK